MLGWLVEAAEQLKAFSAYFLHELPLKQVQLDELYAVLRGCPETSQPRCEAFKPLFGDIGKQDKIAVKAC